MKSPFKNIRKAFGSLAWWRKEPAHSPTEIVLPKVDDPSETEAVQSFYPSTGKNKKTGQLVRLTLKRSFPKVGRNEPCPCGSGLKYKKCCEIKHRL